LVCRRFMAAFLPPAEFLSSEIWLMINGEKFKATGKVFEKLGWLEAEPWAVKDDNPLPALNTGQSLTVTELKQAEKQTKPPPHYTDSTLLRAMETAGKSVEDEELAQAMKERGLGTPATRAQIIEALLAPKRGYAQRQKKSIVATDKGLETVRIISELLPEALSPDLTGEWEFKLKKIEHGLISYQDFMHDIRSYVADSIERVKGAHVQFNNTDTPSSDRQSTQPSPNDTLGACPLCGGNIIETPKAFGCANWKDKNCKFAIWKNAYGGRISASSAKELLTKGETSRLLSLTSAKTQKKYKARLKLENGKVIPVFKS
jgi:DNA topoisomerase III